jgi:hypothetical protein
MMTDDNGIILLMMMLDFAVDVNALSSGKSRFCMSGKNNTAS